MVIDHLGHPPIGSSFTRTWFEGIGRVAENPLVFAKISGLYSVSTDMSAWTTESVRPFFEHACDVFSGQRLMFGGDWPISMLAGGYARVWDGLSPLFDELSESDREAMLGRTAAEFYRLHPVETSSVV
jgi:L-fuconolactonase